LLIRIAEQAKKHCDTVSVSIFVNPSQFAPHEDLNKYPKTLEKDLKMLNSVGVDAVFVPSVSEMYPSGITLDVKQQTGTFVSVHGLSHQLEGEVRPHFFRGVATVVSKLFNVIQPDKAFFGQKDIQQCVVIRNMVKDLLFPIDVVICDTIREKDGLAMSSRNRFLSETERAIAPVLYKALKVSEQQFKSGMFRRDEILNPGRVLLAEQKIYIDYFNLSDPNNLEEIDSIHPKKGAILSAAIRLGTTRLIDNLILGKI
jgi:pantoate--beta-alanine ligase